MLGDDKYGLSLAELDAGIEPLARPLSFVVCMLRIYSDAAKLQYEEAERLMCIALAAKEHADGLMARCADLVAENLGADGEWAPAAEDDDIPW